jgi:hypothetical protein
METCLAIAGLLLVFVVIMVIVLVTRPSKSASAHHRRLEYCPSCDTRLYPTDEHCPRCRLMIAGKLAGRLERNRIAQQEIQVLKEAGQLEEELAHRVVEKLLRRKYELLHPDEERTQRAVPPPLPAIPRRQPPPRTVEPPVVGVGFESIPEKAAAEPEPVASSPKRSLAEVFGQFMHERNILWGELAGGLLIVGCSIALVLSLWRTLEELPYFTFLLIAGITGAVFGAGYYTLHHWKLTGTSRGLLIISLLLTPLNLLLLADPGSRGMADAIDVAVKIVAVIAFVGLVRTGGRDVVGTDALPGLIPRRWLFALALVGAPASQIIPPMGQLPIWLPLACFVIASGVAIGRLSRGQKRVDASPLEASSATAALLFVGLGLFALFSAWGFVLSRADDLPTTLRRLAVPLVIAGVPVLSAGLLVQRRLIEPVALRATGTGVAVAGLIVLFTSLVFAWPEPLTLLAVAIALTVVIGWMAFRDEAPWLYGGAIPSAALAVVLAFNGFAEGWTLPDGVDGQHWLSERITSAQSGALLAGFALFLGVLSEGLFALRRARDARAVARGAAGVAVAALLLAIVNLIPEPALAAATHLICAVVFIAGSFRWRYRAVAHLGVGLVLLASIWGLVAGVPFGPDWGLILAVESLALALAAVGMRRALLLRMAASDVAGTAAIWAVNFAMVSSLFYPNGATQTGTLFLVAATTLVLAGLYRHPVVTWIGSLVGLLAIAHLLAFTLDLQPWRTAALLALLLHATLATTASLVLRRLEPPGGFIIGRLTSLRSPGLFLNPLRYSARLTSCLAVPLLLFPVGGLAGMWTAFAVWTGVLWLVSGLTFRERGTFSAFQAAITWAAVLFGFTWVEQHDWFSDSRFGIIDPRALHAYGIAVGILSLLWVIARRVLSPFEEARRLWSELRPSLDQVVLGVLVIGQLLLAAGGVWPAVNAEMRPLGTAPAFVLAPEAVFIWDTAAWFLLGVLALAVVASLRWWDARWADAAFVGLALLVLTAPFLIAGTFVPELAAASALRWGLAATFLVGSALLAGREPIVRTLASAGFRSTLSPWGVVVLRALFASGAAIVLFLTLGVAILGLSGEVPAGPLEGSIFHQMGWTVSVMVPLAALVIGLAGTALRERSAGYAYAAGWIWIATLAGGYALGVVAGGGSLGPVEQMRTALLACGAAAVWALAWLAVERRVPGKGLLSGHVVIGLLGLSLLCVIPLGLILQDPNRPLGPASARLGIEGWLVLLPAALAAFWHSGRAAPQWRFHAFGLTTALGGVLLACTVKRWDEPGEWLSVHVLAGAWAAAGAALAVWILRDRGERATFAVRIWPQVFAVGLTVLALRSGWADPWRPWSPAALVLIAGFMLGVVAIRARSRWHEYASGALAMLAGMFIWVSYGPDTLTSLAMAMGLGLAGGGSLWALWRAERRKPPDDDATEPPLTHVAAVLSLGMLLLGLVPRLSGADVDPLALPWSTIGVVALLFGILLRDRTATFALGGLYILGVAAIGLSVASLRSGPGWLDWITPIALSAYVLAASVIALGAWQRKPAAFDRNWFILFQATAGALVVALSVRSAIWEADLLVRLTAPASCVLLFAASALLCQSPNRWLFALRPTTLVLGAVVVAMLAWALPDPADKVPWLNRNGNLFIALTVMTTLYLLARTSGWVVEFRRVGGVLGSLALITLALVLVQQIPAFDPLTKRTPLHPFAVGGVLVAILVLIALALRCALRPDRDPLGPKPQGRPGYVYLAEVLLVLLFAHVRLNIPEVFTGQAVKYWTFIVMLLAFIGVGLAELFARRGLTVLSRPLLRTGVLLPLIPLIAFWAKPPAFIMEFADARAPGLRPMLGYLEKLPQHFDVYALLWLLAGLLYGLIALSRRSFGWALLGALATNAGLWALLSHHQVPAAVHPQAWAIPLALIVLVSEHVNRARLRPEVTSGMRYLGICMIYVASAADLFIAGVGESVWLPVILAALCLAGLIAGVLFRVRAFLYLSIGFLLLDVFAMIWYAAVDREQTWIWYASGIVLGGMIIALFAILEKKRNNVRELMGRLREWD